MASVTYDYINSARLISDDIKQLSVENNKNYEVTFLAKLSKYNYMETIDGIIVNLNESKIKISDYFTIDDNYDVLDYIELLAAKNSDDSIIIFSNVKCALLFHEYMIKKHSSDNFIKYCLTGFAEGKVMEENRIRGILTGKSIELANIIYDIIISDTYVDKEINQDLRICSHFSN